LYCDQNANSLFTNNCEAPQEVEEEDEDTVIAEYDVYIAPELQENIYLLQYPNRKREMPYSINGSQEPQQMRIKPKSGFLELDLGMSVQSNFDKFKGVSWGEALRMSKESGMNAFGLASGFGKGARTNEIFAAERAQLQPLSDERVESLLGRFDDTNIRGNVMNKTTLGGQIIQPEEGRPMYMLGAFRGSRFSLPFHIVQLLIFLFSGTSSFPYHRCGPNATSISSYRCKSTTGES
jgi:DNA-directed RNA polymerase III subunit RPC5